MSTRILCIGNELVRDDGVGIRIGRVLAALPLPDGVAVELLPQLGLDLLETVSGADHIVLVDAMHTGRPVGSCVTLDGPAIEGHSAGTSASHSLGIVELMGLARKLAPQRPSASLHLVGVEGGAFAEYGTALSPEVAAAIPVAVEAVLRLVGAGGALLAQAAELSLREMHRAPSIDDLNAG